MRRPCRYDLGELVAGTRASVWYDFRHHWNRSTYYANHEADLLRLLMLRRRGGVYVDADFVLLRPLPRAPHTCPDGMLGIESGEGGARVHGGILAGAEVEGGGALPSGATLCNALMAFERGSAYLDAALEAFVSEYVPYPPEVRSENCTFRRAVRPPRLPTRAHGACAARQLDFWGLLRAGVWGAMGPLLLTRVARRRGAAGPCALERRALYPIAPDEILPAFGAWVDERDVRALARPEPDPRSGTRPATGPTPSVHAHERPRARVTSVEMMTGSRVAWSPRRRRSSRRSDRSHSACTTGTSSRAMRQ